MRAVAFTLTVLLLAGCASGKAELRTARARPDEMALLCKHCNCYMPADVDPESNCTVCNCGYTAGRCVRGR